MEWSGLRRLGADSPECCRLLFAATVGPIASTTESVPFRGAGEALEVVDHAPTILLFNPLDSFGGQYPDFSL